MAAKTCYLRHWQKFGIEVPKMVERALEIDQETGMNHWREALKLEMSKILLAIKILDHEEARPVCYQEM